MQKIRVFLLILILPLLAFSCNEVITVYTRIVNIDSNDTILRLHFEFKRAKNDSISFVDRIDILRNDTLICRLVSRTGKGIPNWEFPSVPNDFQVDSSIKGNEIPEILNSQNIQFEFRSRAEQLGYGSWVYNSKYSESNHRWMFDEKGNQNIKIDSHYEPWIGRDFVKIESTKDFQATDSDFELKNAKGELVDFKVKYKRNPTDKVALVLDQSVKTGEILYLKFRIDSTKTYNETIIVPDKSIIGIAGKYRDL
jgi:hypothetical protein